MSHVMTQRHGIDPELRYQNQQAENFQMRYNYLVQIEQPELPNLKYSVRDSTSLQSQNLLL